MQNPSSEPLGILNSVGAMLKSDAAKAHYRNAGKAAHTLQNLEDAGGSITQLSSKTTIMSRAFIESSVLAEPILANMMRCLHEWYAAQIMAGLSIQQMITDKKSVADVLRPVQDGHNVRHMELLGDVLSRAGGQEKFIGNYLGEAGLEALGPGGMPLGPNDPRNRSSSTGPGGMPKTPPQSGSHYDTRGGVEPGYGRDKHDGSYGSVKMQSVKVGDNKIGPLGELYELTLSPPGNKDVTVRVPLYIQMQPTIVPDTAAPRFIDMNVSGTIWQRWTQMRAGEISFWKDFIGKRDVHKRLKSVLKDPEAGKAMMDFLRTISKKDIYAMDDATKGGVRNGASANLANSVVIFTESTVTQAKNESGIDLHRASDRQRYFRDAYVMIIGVVDPMYQRVTIYFNGLDGALECSYNDFKPNDKKFEPNDFIQALAAFGTGNVNRLR